MVTCDQMCPQINTENYYYNDFNKINIRFLENFNKKIMIISIEVTIKKLIECHKITRKYMNNCAFNYLHVDIDVCKQETKN